MMNLQKSWITSALINDFAFVFADFFAPTKEVAAKIFMCKNKLYFQLTIHKNAFYMISSSSGKVRFVSTGLLFSILWASASAAGKIGLQSVEPLVLFVVRFLSAGLLMLLYAHLFGKNKFPLRSDWKPLLIFGWLNTTLFLGFYVIALQEVSAGIGSLVTAINPLLITVMSGLFMGTKTKRVQWISVLLGMIGIVLATYPLLLNSTATVKGLLLMLVSMLCYSLGVIYYAKQNWQLSSLVINGWQVLLGGLFLLPFVFLFHHHGFINHFDARFWKSEFWLVIIVSIISVQLWLYLLKVDTVRASLWLFLCPIFGFVYAAILLHEPLTTYTYVGTALVILGLYLGQRRKIKA